MCSPHDGMNLINRYKHTRIWGESKMCVKFYMPAQIVKLTGTLHSVWH